MRSPVSVSFISVLSGIIKKSFGKNFSACREKVSVYCEIMNCITAFASVNMKNKGMYLQCKLIFLKLPQFSSDGTTVS